MVEYMFGLMKQLLILLGQDGYKTLYMEILNNYVIEVKLSMGVIASDTLQIECDTNDSDSITIRMWKNEFTRHDVTVKFRIGSEIKTDVIYLALKTLRDLDKANDSVQESGLVKRGYRFSKKCKHCNKVYFNNLITKEQFENMAVNDNVNIDYIIYPTYTAAQITSACMDCTS